MTADPPGEHDWKAAVLRSAADDIGFNGVHPVMSDILPGTRISVHGWPGTTQPSRPLTLRTRALLPFRARRLR